ncbi:MAG: hypothetical protein KQH53_05270 [Desulfarculaceae bacterium]|nr:hypothetical protein [Desulfarculaceae bacterium]
MMPRVVHVDGPAGPEREALAQGLMQALAQQGVAVGLLRANGEGVALSLPLEGGAGEALVGLRGLELVISLLPPGEGQETLSIEPGREAELAEELAARRAKSQGERRLTILADGKPVPAKPFVRDILANSLDGLLRPLHGIQGAGRLEIIIE